MQIFNHPGNVDVEITQADIDFINDGIGDNMDRVCAVLEAFGRNIHYPVWVKDGHTHVSTQNHFVTNLSNLMSGLMMVGIYSGTSIVEWVPVNVSRTHYKGKVYSLEVDTHSLYLANGILS
jgi:hypothetical protein